MSESSREPREGDVIEFTLRGERRTAEAMLITDDGLVLLDLFDGDRPAWAHLSNLDEVVVFATRRQRGGHRSLMVDTVVLGNFRYANLLISSPVSGPSVAAPDDHSL